MENFKESVVYFKNSEVTHSTNDGMQLLGHFLLSQINDDRNAFFIKWLKEKADDTLDMGSYFIEKIGDQIYLDHLEDDSIVPFETTKENMIEIIKHWHGWCTDNQVSACQVGGADVSITRSKDAKTFEFNMHKQH